MHSKDNCGIMWKIGKNNRKRRRPCSHGALAALQNENPATTFRYSRELAGPVASQLGDGGTSQRGFEVELVPITTSGDQQQTASGPIAGTGIFTKEIQRELLDERIDLAVHSLKDLPTETVPGLALAAVPQRAPVADALVCDRFDCLELLPPGAVVGTGSLRRRAQLLNYRPDLEMRDIRGNVDTRLRKLHEGHYEAIILAQAGLERLALAKHITQVLPLSLMLPAVGQGALGIEARAHDTATREALAFLDHMPTHAAVTAERALLAALHGGCMAPIAAWGRMDGEQLILSGRVLDPAGTESSKPCKAARWTKRNRSAAAWRTCC